jgi:hypothetical protein
LVPYFFGVYIIPIPVILLISLVFWSDYASSKESYQQERQTLAFEESILQQRLDGSPMMRAACEAETGDAYLCKSRSCVPASEGEPELYLNFEPVSAGQADLFCPVVPVLEGNVMDARRSLEATERYGPPITELIPALITLGTAALMALLLAMEVLRHLLSATRSGRSEPQQPAPSTEHSSERTGPSPLLMAGGCLLAATILGGLATALAGAAYVGYTQLAAEPEWEVPPLYSDETVPEHLDDYQKIDASMAQLEPWLTAGCAANPRRRVLVEVSLSEAVGQKSQVVATRIREGGNAGLERCILTHMQSGVSVNRTQTRPIRVTHWFTWP